VKTPHTSKYVDTRIRTTTIDPGISTYLINTIAEILRILLQSTSGRHRAANSSTNGERRNGGVHGHSADTLSDVSSGNSLHLSSSVNTSRALLNHGIRASNIGRNLLRHVRKGRHDTAHFSLIQSLVYPRM